LVKPHSINRITTKGQSVLSKVLRHDHDHLPAPLTVQLADKSRRQNELLEAAHSFPVQAATPRTIPPTFPTAQLTGCYRYVQGRWRLNAFRSAVYL
jgi:hypothetical protein